MHFVPEDDAGVSSQHSNTQSPAPGVAAEATRLQFEQMAADRLKWKASVIAQYRTPAGDYHHDRDLGLMWLAWCTALQASAAAVPETQTYVQQVPEQCDRITWRGRYYSLPLPAQVQAAEVMPSGKLLQRLTELRHRWNEMKEIGYKPGAGELHHDRVWGPAAMRTIVDHFEEIEALASRTPAPGTVSDWGIDTSTGTKILVHKNCSVIEDEQAELVLRLLGAPGMAGGVVQRAVSEVEAVALLNLMRDGPHTEGDVEQAMQALAIFLDNRPAPHPSPAPQAATKQATAKQLKAAFDDGFNSYQTPCAAMTTLEVAWLESETFAAITASGRDAS